MKYSFLPEEEKYALKQSNWDFSISYKVFIKIILYYPVRNESTISYTIKVGCTQPEEFNSFYYELEKENLIINNQEPQNSFDQIAIAINQVFNTLECEVRYNGQLEKILNQAEIVKKWNKKKKYLINNYKGQAIHQFINKTDQKIKTEQMHHKLLKDPFLLVYFGKYYFDIQDATKKMIAIDYFAGVTIPYTVTEEQKKKDALIVINRQGVSNFSEKEIFLFNKYMSDKGWIADTVKNNNTKATIESITTIDPNNGKIQEIQGIQNLSIKGQKVKKSTISIQKI